MVKHKDIHIYIDKLDTTGMGVGNLELLIWKIFFISQNRYDQRGMMSFVQCLFMATCVYKRGSDIVK